MKSEFVSLNMTKGLVLNKRKWKHAFVPIDFQFSFSVLKYYANERRHQPLATGNNPDSNI